ncbi:hypothetical protein HDV05_006566 [Chytridiales sp. JEL 0842]|nr:hypothetical protein HDV05_006566 [Chytridiales sp. JEL 0842]
MNQLTLVAVYVAVISSLFAGQANGLAQVYYKGCQGNWQFNDKFRTPTLNLKFTAKAADILVRDCAIACGKPKDYIFLAPASQGSPDVSCWCVAANDPTWVQMMAEVRPINDDMCRPLKCKDGENCGGIDGTGTHWGSFLVNSIEPNAEQGLSPAAKAAIESDSPLPSPYPSIRPMPQLPSPNPPPPATPTPTPNNSPTTNRVGEMASNTIPNAPSEVATPGFLSGSNSGAIIGPSVLGAAILIVGGVYLHRRRRNCHSASDVEKVTTIKGYTMTRDIGGDVSSISMPEKSFSSAENVAGYPSKPFKPLPVPALIATSDLKNTDRDSSVASSAQTIVMRYNDLYNTNIEGVEDMIDRHESLYSDTSYLFNDDTESIVTDLATNTSRATSLRMSQVGTTAPQILRQPKNINSYIFSTLGNPTRFSERLTIRLSTPSVASSDPRPFSPSSYSDLTSISSPIDIRRIPSIVSEKQEEEAGLQVHVERRAQEVKVEVAASEETTATKEEGVGKDQTWLENMPNHVSKMLKGMEDWNKGGAK